MDPFGKYANACDTGGASAGLRANQGPREPANYIDHEIFQLTKLMSGPHERLSRMATGKSMLSVSPVKMLAGREGNYSGRGRFSSADRCHVLSRYLPTSSASRIDQMDSCAYVSQFSADGSLFVAGFQESRIRVYNVDAGWKVQKDIQARSLRWTITDATLSPDQRFLVYASISPVAHIVKIGSAATESVANVTEIHEGLVFCDNDDREYSFGIFSVKFSTDGRELVAACSAGSIYVYDLEANKPTLRIPAHTSDVNAVCFADESGHLIYSGSDDNLCKVWDRRCFATKGQAAGVLMGHIEGITFIDSRGDGRYFISNGKDQAIKLWDIRKMSSNFTRNPRLRNGHWDYRWMDYPPEARNLRHPRDQSLATYKGHEVLRTLIRCYFSPAYSTGQKYIYTGSSDSFIYIYDLLESLSAWDWPFSSYLCSSTSVAPCTGKSPALSRRSEKINKLSEEVYHRLFSKLRNQWVGSTTIPIPESVTIVAYGRLGRRLLGGLFVRFCENFFFLFVNLSLLINICGTAKHTAKNFY